MDGAERAPVPGPSLMCPNGTDLSLACRLCGRPLLSCWDDGPAVSWHASAADALACASGTGTEA
jgi:hypothetical protein